MAAPFHRAAFAGNLESLKKLADYDFNAKDEAGRTPLFYAAEAGQKEIVEWLLEKGADPNIAETSGSKNPPLHIAVLLPSDEVAALFLDHGAAIDAVNSKGEQAIHHSILNSHADCLSLLIKRKADVNAKDSEMLTPLCWAESSGKEPFVRILLDANADPDLVTSQGIALNLSIRENAEAAYGDKTKALAQECRRRRDCGLRFGVTGYSKVSPKDSSSYLALEGDLRNGGGQAVANTMQAFSVNEGEPKKALYEEAWSSSLGMMQGLAAENFPLLSKEDQDKIIKDYLKKLMEGKTIAIPAGSEGHTVYMVFKKTKEGLLFVNCDRGERDDAEEGGITLCTIKNPDQLNAGALRRLLLAQDTFTESHMLLRLDAAQEEHIGIKNLKIGACSFTSAKLAVFAGLYLFFKEKGLNHSQAFEHAKKLYRSWKQFDQAKAIHEMLNAYKKNPAPPYVRDDQLLLSAVSKMKTEGPMHPEYAEARQQLMDFLDKNASVPWTFDYEVDNSYLSPLTYAVRTKQKDLIELMLKKGGKINDKDPGGWTPLQRAVHDGDLEMLSFLIEHGAEISTPETVRLALEWNRKDIAKYLLEKAKKQGVDLRTYPSKKFQSFFGFF
jgi:ankyrin repeat protein